MASGGKGGGGGEGTSSAGGKGLEGMEELARALPGGGDQRHERRRREPTEADLERYRGYAGQMWTGVCKWYNIVEGYGFIVPDEEDARRHGDDVFVHQSSLQMEGFRSLDEGVEVEFIVQLGDRGRLEATDVSGIGGQPIRGHRIQPIGMRKDGKIRCFKCGKFGGHKAADCKRIPHVRRNVNRCYVCGSADHLAADCPIRKDFPGGGEGPRR